MQTSVTPSTLLLRQLDEFFKLLPNVREGSVEAIHEARVASRRMRAILPLLAGRLTPSDLEHFGEVLRRVGRCRDLDVQLELLQSLEPALPRTGADVQELRAAWRAKRERRVRRLVKSFERLRVEHELHHLAHLIRDRAPLLFSIRRHASAASAWDAMLAGQMRELAGRLAADIDRAGGLMFPNRLHSARVTIKKLRYATEIATVTGMAHLDGAVRAMRKTQQLLGRIHDLDVLASTLRDTSHGEERILPLVDFQRRVLHQRYLRRRDSVLTACSEAAIGASRDRRARVARRAALIAALPVAALALPLARRA
jgi:CHAD domain-containing protein